MNSRKIYSTIGQAAPLYDRALKISGYQKSVEDFIFHIPFPSDASIKVLDAGCGTGLYSLAVLHRYKNAHVTAFDLDENLVRRLRQKVLTDQIHTFTADLGGPLDEIQGQKFDLIITAGVLEYVPLQKTVERLTDFLAPGGYFLNSPVRDTLHGRLVGKMYGCVPYSQEENIQAFKSSGLKLQEVIKTNWNPLASFKEAHIFKKD